MHIRPVTPGDLDLFIDAAGFPEHRNEVRQYMKRMLDAGSMRPDWCFVAEDEGHPLGRVALWTLPGMEEPFAIVLFDVKRDDEHVQVGRRLLEEVLAEARTLGAEEIEHVIDDPPMRPQFQHHPRRRIELLEGVGFTFRRETGRFEWRGEGSRVEPGWLSFRTLEEVGEAAFVDAMEIVSESTLDREILEERQRLGARRAAREFFDDAQRVEHDPSWWRLAYTPDGQLVGLVMPAEPPGFLTIFYIGVLPGMRGRGYVDDLLAAGTTLLLERKDDNDKPLIADTDIANTPMAGAFERAGWTRFAGRREYVVKLGADQA